MDSIVTSTDKGVLSITMNRPEKRNALTNEMYLRIDEALSRAAEDASVRLVLLRGAGGSFTAGNDLRDFVAFARAEQARIQDLPVAHLFLHVNQFEKPLLAAVDGPALGFGTTFLLHCDAVVATRTSQFGLPFSRLGLVPEFGSTLLLPEFAGPSRARYHMLLGESFGAFEAHALGIVHELCEPHELDTQAGELCSRFLAKPDSTLRSIKRLTRSAAYRARIQEAIEYELRAFEEALRSPEHAEAVTAFFEKRLPDFGDPTTR